MIELPAYAKLNLTLDILWRRPDGYHEISSVMQSISLHDTVRVALTAGEDIVCRCGDIPGDETNLAVRAARAFFAETGIVPHRLNIEIEKRIPSGAGLGGGSSDAAAVLRALRTLLSPALSDSALEEIGARVGSDVPFCVRGGTALAQGRGEALTTLCGTPAFHVVVCKPDFSIATPMLFRRCDEAPLRVHPDTGAMLAAIDAGNAPGVAAQVCNAFEQVLPRECGDVLAIKRQLLSRGAAAGAMTGSGSAVFGLFEDENAAQAAFDALKARYAQTFLEEFV